MRIVWFCLAAAFAALPLSASAGTLVKFSVTEVRIAYYPDDAGAGRLSLELRGQATVFSDPIEFTWEVTDPERYMPLLQACGDGRINGEVEFFGDMERNGKTLEGKGALSELRCRHILK